MYRLKSRRNTLPDQPGIHLAAPRAMNNDIIRTIRRQDWTATDREAESLTREWLVTNGIGGYASGTVAGVATRRYHGLLVSAQPAPLGRQMLFLHLMERLHLPDGSLIKLSGEPHERNDLFLHGADHLSEFRLEMGLPTWRYEFRGMVLEKQIVLPYEQNTVYVIYRLLAGEPARLKLLPCLHNRSHDAPVSEPLPGSFSIHEKVGHLEFDSRPGLPSLRMQVQGVRTAFTIERSTLPEVLYSIEASRGYERTGALWSPGYFRGDLSCDHSMILVASTEPWQVVEALDPETAREIELERRRHLVSQAPAAARQGLGAELVLAADQFLIKPAGRVKDAARIKARGDQIRTVIAGYHWFTDWGRDTMISLEGLTLATGRAAEAGYILRTFAHYIKDGLIPNLFPEGQNEGLYHTADATLWFFHALSRYVTITNDRKTLEQLLPKLTDIAQHHLAGTHFGIRIDPKDGLLQQGAEGYQLTWMDAKVEDWVVTPRRGKAVELNALWYNALCLLEKWHQEFNGSSSAQAWSEEASRMRASFNQRFWYEAGGHLYDVVDGEKGDDAACRPNQLFAFSLPHQVLDRQRWEPVLKVVQRELVTPVGLRSLAKGHPDYRSVYFGDRRARDAAYHQGTVWGWLIGPFIDAWLNTYPADKAGAREFLTGFNQHLDEAGLGSISEVFDAEPPFVPRGCVAQAWSIAEVLRCWLKTSDDPTEE